MQKVYDVNDVHCTYVEVFVVQCSYSIQVICYNMHNVPVCVILLHVYNFIIHIKPNYVCPCSVPSGPPQSLEATNVEQTTITISWRPPPPYEQNGVITRYQVTFDSSVTQTTALSFTASSLVPNSEYVITVAAGNSVGFGPATEIPVTTKPPGKYKTFFHP